MPNLPLTPLPEPKHLGFRELVPGVIAGAADLDPAAVLTATIAGAQFGYSVAWVVLVCIPVLRTVFGVSSRLGGETRMGLVELIRDQFGNYWARTIAFGIVAVNLLMILGDIVAVSEAGSIILDQRRLYFLALTAFAVWYVLIFVGYNKITTTLAGLSLFLLAYIGAAYIAVPSASALVTGVLLPHISFTSSYLMAVIAVFGSLLTPDVLVWQASSKRGKQMRVDEAHPQSSLAGTAVAVLVSLAVIVAATQMKVADPAALTFRQAAEALRPVGQLGPMIFAVGIIGSGMVALPILVASLCFSIAEAYGWRSGLYTMPWEAKRFYFLISAVVVVAGLFDMIGLNAVKILYWSQVIAGFVLVPILVFVLLLGRRALLVRTVNTKTEDRILIVTIVLLLLTDALFVMTAIF